MAEASVVDSSVDQTCNDSNQQPTTRGEGWDIEDADEEVEANANADADADDLYSISTPKPTPTTTTTTPTTTTTTTTTETSSSSTSSQKQEDDAADDSTHRHEGESMFDCNICLEQPEEPVVTMCGHLFCWACIFRWLELHPEYQTCPVCKAGVTVDKVIPLYGRGKEEKDPRTRRPDTTAETTNVPRRPQGQRAEPVYNFVPPFSGLFPGTSPFATTQIGNVSFSAGFSIFPSLLGLQFVTATGGAPMAGNGRPEEMNLEQQQQQAFLSRMLFMLGTVVVIFLLLFN